MRKLLKTMTDRLAPILFGGMLLGVWQGIFLLYLYHDKVPNWNAMMGLLSTGIFLSFVWVVLFIPYIGFRCSGYFSKCPLDSPHLALQASLEVVMATATWSLVHALGEPLIENRLLSQSYVHILAVALALAAAFMARFFPKQSLRRIRLGGILAIVFLIISLSQARNADKAPMQRANALLQADPGIQAAADAPDVIVITVDALRADHLGCYSKAAPPTPALDRLAEKGVRFERVLAPSPWTLPSLASFLCALPVTDINTGYRLDRLHSLFRSPLAPEHITLAEQFRAAGYRTAAIVGNPWVSHTFGMNQGFHRFRNPSELAVMLGSISEIPLGAILNRFISNSDMTNDRARAMTDTALEWLNEAGNGPLFLWIHYIDPHIPYNANPEDGKDNSMLVEFGGGAIEEAEDGSLVGDYFAAVHEVRTDKLRLTPSEKERVHELYALEVQYTDRHVGRLLESLQTRPRSPIVAFTSDHGEEFWEHGGFEHGHNYYRETTQIPLILCGPGIPSNRVVEQPVGLIDLGPTLLELAGLGTNVPGQPERGVSLVGMWDGRGVKSLPRFCENNLHNQPSRLVVDGPWRYILRENGQQELYNIIEDPKELRNQAYDREEISGRLYSLLEKRGPAPEQSTGSPNANQMKAIEALRSLGYVD